MDDYVSVEEFNAALWKRFQDGKIRNVYPLLKYKDIIEKIKVMNENPPCNIPGEYYLLRKFVVVKVDGRERLSCKSENNENAEDNNSVIKFYVALEEIYDYLEEAHRWVKHGCKGRILRKIQNQGILNITRDTVELFLSYCKLCRPRKRDVSRKGVLKTSPVTNIPNERFSGSPVNTFPNNVDINNHSNDINEGQPVVLASTAASTLNLNTNSTVCTFTRGFVDLIDLTACPDGDYRFAFLYLDIQTCFSVLYPTRCKCKYEIASHLLNTFTLIGPPQILHSNLDSQFLISIINELKLSWPDIVMVSGSNNYTELQQVAENCSAEINCMLKSWLRENNSSNWSFGLKIVQYRKNSKLPSNGTKSPYECFFGRTMHSPNFPSHLNLSTLKDIKKEDDLLALINEQNSSEQQPCEHLQVALDPDICKFVYFHKDSKPAEEKRENGPITVKTELCSDEENANLKDFDSSDSSCDISRSPRF